MATNTITTTHSARLMSMPAVLLRAEGLTVLVGTVALYAYAGYSWLAFVPLLLVPDVTLGIYMLNKRVGTLAYNLVHSSVLPLALGVLSVLTGNTLGQQLALVWLAHIGMDRAIGYGLKYQSGFKDTHLGRA